MMPNALAIHPQYDVFQSARHPGAMGRVAETLELCARHSRIAEQISHDLASARLLRLKAAYAQMGIADVHAEPIMVDAVPSGDSSECESCVPHFALRVVDGLPSRPEDAGPPTAYGLRVAECAYYRCAIAGCLELAVVRAQILNNVSSLEAFKDTTAQESTLLDDKENSPSSVLSESTAARMATDRCSRITGDTGEHIHSTPCLTSISAAAQYHGDSESLPSDPSIKDGDYMSTGDLASLHLDDEPSSSCESNITFQSQDACASIDHIVQTTAVSVTHSDSEDTFPSDTSDDELGVRALYAVEEASVSHAKQSSIGYTSPDGAVKLHLSLVGQHSLWGHHLWNGARWMADWICAHPGCFRAQRVVELGAGAGLPSIVADIAGDASAVLCTDYPDDDLVANLAANIASSGAARTQAEPFLWGESEFLAKNTCMFDVAFLCDVVFNHSEHGRLLHSIETLLGPYSHDVQACSAPYAPIAAEEIHSLMSRNIPVAFCVFTHYRPWLAERDMAFVHAAAASGLWIVRHIESRVLPDLMFPEDACDARVTDPDVMRTVHAYLFIRCGPTAGDSEECDM